MVRILLILTLGAVIGYGYGFRDAQFNEKTVVARVLDRLGGDARQYSANDADAALRQAER